jgi:toxin ParE1/3/4
MISNKQPYYDQARPGLGDDLYEAVGRALEFIISFPEASLRTARGAIRYNLKRFPYFIIYRVIKAEIVVGAIGHGHCEPNFWLGRNFEGE